jgi:hypothetical protein
MKYLLILLFLASCSHKITVKNCEHTDTEYSVCDTLNLLGK